MMKRVLACFLALVMLLCCACSSSGRGAKSPEKAVEAFLTAYASLDAKKLLECIPDFVIEYGMKEEGVSKESELINLTEEEFKGEEKVKIKILEIEADYDYYDDDDLEDFKSELESKYDLAERQLKKITELCRVTFTIKFDGGKSGSNNMACMKYDGRWYVLDLVPT